MGEILSVFFSPQKRKRSPDSLGDSNEPPKKKKLLTVTQYVYKALFQEQQDSDVAVMALDKVWHLHKLYLCQSPYFRIMFNGTWREAHEKSVQIEILDDLITVDSLDAVFGSMYSDVLEIKAEHVIPVVATATLFHMDVIIDRCVEVMLETINQKTATQYYDAACRYAVRAVKESTIQWFQFNLVRIYSNQPNPLRQISIELMTALTASADLHAYEYALYCLLRTWMFLRLHPDYDPEDPVRQAEALTELQRAGSAGVDTYMSEGNVVERTYFSGRGEGRSFLATPEGQPYVAVFQKLRTQYLTNYHPALEIVLSDNIIPKEWIHRHIVSQWDALLRIDRGLETWSFQQVDDEKFFKTCMRYERIVTEPRRWTWVDFKFGLYLMLALDHRRLSIRRHHRHHRHHYKQLLSLNRTRQIMIRATVASVNAEQQPVLTQSSRVCSLNLAINEEVPILLLDSKQAFPMIVHVNMLVVPPSEDFKEIAPHSEAAKATITGEDISDMGGDCERLSSVGDLMHLSGSSESS